VINTRINNFLENNNKIDECQAGFRKNARTSDQVFILKHLIDVITKQRNGRLYACFIDYKKAFDSVWHNGLLVKLFQIGVQGRCFSIIRDMYTNSKIKTKDSSQEILIKRGVHQGNTLSPTLFNIFINDIVQGMPNDDSPCIDKINNQKISCLLYADDLLLLSTTKKGLQAKLDHIHLHCDQWGLEINRDKSKVVIFSKMDIKKDLFFQCGEHIIETTDSYKYLGIMFNKNGSFSTAEEYLLKNAKKAKHALNRAIFKENINMSTVLQLFDSLVLPVATYGSEIWFAYSVGNATENLHAFFQKCIFNKLAYEDLHINFCR
jgi:hypothetical protein